MLSMSVDGALARRLRPGGVPRLDQSVSRMSYFNRDAFDDHGHAGKVVAHLRRVAVPHIGIDSSITFWRNVSGNALTRPIPIVMAFGNDPVGAGLVANVARFNGNITGMAADSGDEIQSKRLQLLKGVIPKVSRAVVHLNPDFGPNQGRWAMMAS